MIKNIKLESELSDNEKKHVYIIDCKDRWGKRSRFAIWASNIDECTRIFKENVQDSYITYVVKMTEEEYKDRF